MLNITVIVQTDADFEHLAKQVAQLCSAYNLPKWWEIPNGSFEKTVDAAKALLKRQETQIKGVFYLPTPESEVASCCHLLWANKCKLGHVFAA